MSRSTYQRRYPDGGCDRIEQHLRDIYESGSAGYALEFAHGYTYSGHPVACAAGLAALDILVDERLPERVAAEAPYFEGLLHDHLADKPHVLDVRNYGFAGALTLEAYPDEPLRRPFEVAMRLWEKGFWFVMAETPFS